MRNRKQAGISSKAAGKTAKRDDAPTARQQSHAPSATSVALAAAAVFAFSVICYANGLDGAFVFDDIRAISDNPDVQGKTPLLAVLEHDYWGKDMTDPSSHKTFRPITTLTYRLNSALSSSGGDKMEPFWFHVTNVVLQTEPGCQLHGSRRASGGALLHVRAHSQGRRLRCHLQVRQ